MPQNLKTMLAAVAKKRQHIFQLTNAVRLVNGAGDGLPGLIIERYNRHYVVQILDKRWVPDEGVIADFLQRACGAQYIIIKDRSDNPSANKEAFTIQEFVDKLPSTTTVEEYGLKFHVNLNDGLNTGLFLDMRRNRHTLGKLAKGKKVLNCFAYTCSFGVHCKANGASSVVNVDVSNTYLKRGEENYALNNIPFVENDFVHSDAVFYLDRAAAKANLFDLIIIDPPSFSHTKDKTFSVKKDLESLIACALKALEPKGQLFIATNLNAITTKQIEKMARTQDSLKQIVSISIHGQDNDFVGSGKSPESYLAAVLIRTA